MVRIPFVPTNKLCSERGAGVWSNALALAANECLVTRQVVLCFWLSDCYSFDEHLYQWMWPGKNNADRWGICRYATVLSSRSRPVGPGRRLGFSRVWQIVLSFARVQIVAAVRTDHQILAICGPEVRHLRFPYSCHDRHLQMWFERLAR